MTYNLTNRLEAESFHDYRLNMFFRELGIAYSNSEASTNECLEFLHEKGLVSSYKKFWFFHYKKKPYI